MLTGLSLCAGAQELNYGPNGGLIYCMESVAQARVCTSDSSPAPSLTRLLLCVLAGRYLLEHLSWLGDAINDFGDDYLIFGAPLSRTARDPTPCCSPRAHLWCAV